MMGMRTTYRNGVKGVLIGPVAIPVSFLWSLLGLVVAGWLAFCITLDVAFGGKGAGASLFFIPLFGVAALVGLVALVGLIIKQFRALNRGSK